MKRTRREFIRTSAIGVAGITLSGMGLSAASYNRIIGSNERINVALIGLGRRLGAFPEPIAMKEANTHLLYLCDVKESQRENAARVFSDHIDYQPRLVNDLRKIMDDPNVDAIINAMPDHWHAPGAIMGVKSGKHVFVEKPGSHNARENELLVEARRKYGKLIQLGNQQRSAPESIEIIRRIHEGAIGEPYKAVTFYSNARGAVPNQTPAEPPQGLDWYLFQGPSPKRHYTHDTWDYNWHWYGWDFGTAEIGNNGIHELDIARWALQADYPEKVTVKADKRHFMEDGWTMYDTMKASFYYPGNKTIIWDSKSRNGYPTYGSGRGTIIYGTEGSVYVDRDGYKLFDRNGRIVSEKSAAGSEGGVALGGGGDMSTIHVLNFFNAIRGKESLNSPIEEMVKSIQLCHLANLSYRIKKDLDVNPDNGKTIDPDALRLWSREYQPGWEPEV